MMNVFFRNLTQCSSLKVKRRFGGTCCHYLKGDLAALFILVSCLAYYFILKTEALCSSVTLVDFKRLHGVISQEIKRFVGFSVYELSNC
jgi:hypothetical protein